MMKLINCLRTNRRITNRLVDLILLADSKDKYMMDTLSYLGQRLYLSKMTGYRITDKDLQDWAISHLEKALLECYKKKTLTKDQTKLILKAERDLINIFAKNRKYESISDFLHKFIENERYEAAAFVRDMLKEEK